MALSVTEAELIAGCKCAQDMMYVYHVLKGLELEVELPMILEIDNLGAVDIANNWSSSGRTRHMDIKYKFLRELKEANLIRVVWTPTFFNEADLFTKNLSQLAFEIHISKLVGYDEYMDSQGEGVEV